MKVSPGSRNSPHQTLVPILSSCVTPGKFFMVLGPWFHGKVEITVVCASAWLSTESGPMVVWEGNTHLPLANSCMTAGMLVKVKMGSTAKGSCGEWWRLRLRPCFDIAGSGSEEFCLSSGWEPSGTVPKSPECSVSGSRAPRLLEFECQLSLQLTNPMHWFFHLWNGYSGDFCFLVWL